MSIFRTKNLDDMVAATRTPGGLQKVLGPMDLVLMGIGAIVGTGIFVLTGTGALTAGPALTISFVVAALACGFVHRPVSSACGPIIGLPVLLGHTASRRNLCQ